MKTDYILGLGFQSTEGLSACEPRDSIQETGPNCPETAGARTTLNGRQEEEEDETSKEVYE
jgi:hypothetical protein